MAKSCIGCGKAMGGLVGAYGVKLLYGEVCLTCNKKLGAIPHHEFLTPTQIKDVISGRTKPSEVNVSTEFTHPGAMVTQARQASVASADDIKQYEELMNQGTITQDEYYEIKRQLIGLSPVEEIRRYKGLLDDGIISQDEFEEAKKRLMGLSAADEIKRYKELLDSRMIDKEEFEAVKKRLLQI